MDPALKAFLEALGLDPSKFSPEMETAATAYSLSITKGLKTNRDELRADNDKLKKQLKKLDGVDLDALAAALDEHSIDPADLVERIAAKPNTGAVDVDKIKKDAEAAAEAKSARKLKAVTDERDAARTETANERTIRINETVSRELTEAIVAAKGNSALLLANMKGRVKGEVGEDGKVKITVLAANGEPMTTASGADGSIKDLVESFRKDENFGIAFEAQGGGSGSKGQPNRSGARSGNPWAKDTRNLTEQSRIARESPALAETMKREAGVAV